MILGLGEDLVSTDRIAKLLGNKHQDRFLKRVYSEKEREQAQQIKNDDLRLAWLAKRFAAKEACAKALGSGISGGINFYDIETLNDVNGRPMQFLHGVALQRLNNICPEGMHPRVHVTLSDELPLAKATVIIEAL
jgi:holo-[acyl-carrier protein] synthase